MVEKTRWCKNCGYKKEDVDLRRWECPECSTTNILGDTRSPKEEGENNAEQ